MFRSFHRLMRIVTVKSQTYLEVCDKNYIDLFSNLNIYIYVLN